MKSLNALFTTAICLFWIGSVAAQQATLKGQVTDSAGEGLVEATVKTGASTGTLTDLDGYYELLLDPGTYNLEVSYVGLETQNITTTLASGEVKVMNITMKESANLLGEITIKIDKHEKKLGESVTSVAVIQPTLAEQTNSTAIDQVIEKVPGVTIIDGQPNIRGGSGYSYGAGSRVLLLVDDMPFLASDAGFPNWRDVPVENLEQIEILKGAASALYGSSALNGVINVRTATPTSETKTNVSTYSTAYFKPRLLDTCRLASGCPEPLKLNWWGEAMPFDAGTEFAHRQKFGNFDLVLGGNIYYQNSFRKEEYDRKGRVNFNTRYRINDRMSFGVNGNFNIGRSSPYFVWENPYEGSYESFTFGGAFSTTTQSKVFRYIIDPYFTAFDKAGNRHKVLTRYYYINNDNGNNQGNQSKLTYGEYQYQRTFENLGLNVVAGAVGSYTKVDAELYGNAIYSTSNIASYLQFDKKFFDKLGVTGGVRYERNEINSPDSIIFFPSRPEELYANPTPKATESKPVFRLGLNYQPADYTYIRASWGQGYRYPTIAEKFISTSIGNGTINVLPNPTLQSETGWSAELGLSQGFKISDWLGFTDLSFFWTEYQNMMEFSFGGADPQNPLAGFQSINVGNTLIRGAEISVVGEGKLFGKKTSILAGYTYIDPKYKEWTQRDKDLSTDTTQNILKYRFQHSAKFTADMTILKEKFNIGTSLVYNSYMKAIDRFFTEVPIEVVPGVIAKIDLFKLREYRERNQTGNITLDLRMGYNISKEAKVSIIVNNVLNNLVSLRPALMEAPLNATLRLDYRFKGEPKK
jgi:outer membrane receptor protein involved in Fe transport